jgi:hypothetical protein
VDPLAPEYVWNSPYAFAENRVIDGIDLEGLEWWPGWVTIGRGVSRLAVETSKTTAEMCRNVSWNRVTPRYVPRQFQDHHLIPQQFRNTPEVQTAIRRGFRFDRADNIETLSRFSRSSGEGQHANHPRWNAEFQRRLTEFRKSNPEATEEQQFEFIRNTAESFREMIRNNPDTKVNDMYTLPLPVIEKDATQTAPPVRLKTEEEKQKAKDLQEHNDAMDRCPDCI